MYKPVTIAEFEIWLRASKRGERYVYHVGHLAQDRVEEISERPIEPLNSLAERIMSRSSEGLVTLVQRRQPGDASLFMYEAVKL